MNLILKFLMTSSFYPPYHIGGDAIHVKYLAEELTKIGHDVHVFYSLDAHKIKGGNQKGTVESERVFVHPIKTLFSHSSYTAYVLGRSSSVTSKFNSLLEEIKPDVVHHHNISLLGYNILKKKRSYTNLYTAHDYWLICQQNNLLRNGINECLIPSCFACSLKIKRPPQLWRSGHNFKDVVGNIDLLIAPCKFLQRKITQEISVTSVMIRNFAPFPPNHILGSDFSNYYLFVGSLEEHKGIMNLLEVFRKSRERIGAKLLIVGNGSLRFRIKHFIRQHSLDNLVIILGSATEEQLYSLYRNARALVVPSIWPENSPLVIMEALSVGTPSIVSNLGGLPELMQIIDPSLIFSSIEELEHILINFPSNLLDRESIRRLYEVFFSPKAYIGHYLKIVNDQRALC
jgi:glycosyltransferase involved in cell wall biosynthesis